MEMEHMSEKKKPIVTRNFMKNLSRGAVKSIPVGGALLEQVIYGTLDGEAAKEEAEKLRTALAKISKRLEGQDVNFGDILDALEKEAAFREQISDEIGQIKALLKDPESGAISDRLADATERVLSPGLELADVMNKLANMVPTDLETVIASFPEASPYVPEDAEPRKKANKLAAWASKQKPSRIPHVVATAKFVDGNF
jgi:hypothetical protein